MIKHRTMFRIGLVLAFQVIPGPIVLDQLVKHQAIGSGPADLLAILEVPIAIIGALIAGAATVD